MNAEFRHAESHLSADERAFYSWLARVETLSAGRVDSTGVELLMSDEALEAFQEGVTAADYALKLQAEGAGA